MEKDFNTSVSKIIILSINKNSISLMEQMEEYSWIAITPEQLVKLTKLERELHDLVKEITK
jgi:hypothetical protein